jgi:prevent-host-death family protein
MERTVSATEARIHFGELMRKVVERDETVIIERSGKPQVVVLSFDEYQRRLRGKRPESDWKERVRETREMGHNTLAGRPLPDIDDLINGGREERDAAIFDGLR